MIENLRKFLAEPLFPLRKDVTTGTGLSTPQAGLTHYDYTDGPHAYVGKAEKCEKCGCGAEDQIHKALNKHLIGGTGKEAFQENVRTEIAAGKPQDQAVAIAYAEQKKIAKGGLEK